MSEVVEIGLDAKKCPICREIRQKALEQIELLKALGAPEEEIEKLKKQKYCPLHQKVLKMFAFKKYKNAERIFKPSENGDFINVMLGYKAVDDNNQEKQVTILLKIPKQFNGKRISVIANGRRYTVSSEFLNVLTIDELRIIKEMIANANNNNNN